MGISKKEIQDSTIYRVQRDLGQMGIFRVSKRIMDVDVESYHVTLKENTPVFCDCPGFVRQKFNPEKHKHIRVVKDYLARGAPAWADYRFRGAGKDTKIRFLESSDE